MFSSGSPNSEEQRPAKIKRNRIGNQLLFFVIYNQESGSLKCTCSVMVSESARNPRLGSLKMPQSSACKKLNMQIIMKKDFAKALIEAFSMMYLRFEGCCFSFSLLSHLDLVRIISNSFYF